MGLLKIKDVMARLGYKSPQSIYNLKDKGELRIVHLPSTSRKPGKTHRSVGSPRIPSEDVDRIEQRVLSGESSNPIGAPPKPRLSSSREASRPRPVVQHFE